jgi:ZIP family zinc transporter
LVLSDDWVAIYLAGFAGIVIYLATSHILPEAHSLHSSRWTIASTLVGVAIMWTLVSYLHSGEEHDHASHDLVIEEINVPL